MLQTYEGIVQQRSIRLPPGVELTDGTRVHVTVVPTLDERLARRKAAMWLAENVGDMVMPGSATLARQDNHSVWRFPVMLGSPFDDPRGPFGYIDIDVETGTVLSPPSLAEQIIHDVENSTSSVSASGN
jgi:hypothetical protein